MTEVVCPHCGASKSIVAPPPELVVVAPCPKCGEWVLLFRKKAIAIDRNVLENGSLQEKKAHVADIVGTFLEPDIEAELGKPLVEETEQHQPEELPRAESIPQREIDDFINIDLHLIHKKNYFERLFGKVE